MIEPGALMVGIGSVPVGSCFVWRTRAAGIKRNGILPSSICCGLRAECFRLLANPDGGLANADSRLPNTNSGLTNTDGRLAYARIGLTNTNRRLTNPDGGLTDTYSRLAHTDGGLANSYCRLPDACIGLADPDRGLAQTAALAANRCGVLGACEVRPRVLDGACAFRRMVW